MDKYGWNVLILYIFFSAPPLQVSVGN